MPSLKLPAKKHDIKTEEEEYQLFREYYTIFFRKTKYKADDMEALADELARDIVYNDGKFTFFEDVESTLEKLKDHYKLGIVSDSWPPLRRVYKNKGLLDFFSCFVISSMYNSRKQKGKLFEIALGELNVKPQEVLFIDDLEHNLSAAERLGITAVKMDRYKRKKSGTKYAVVNSLEDLQSVSGKQQDH